MSCKASKPEKNLFVRVLVPLLGRHYQKKWFFNGGAEGDSTVIPFENVNGWITVKVRLNDQLDEHKFIFDTGAITVIDTELGKQLNVAELKDFTKTDVNGVKREGKLVSLSKIAVGRINFLKAGALTSTSELFKCYGIKGILGYNLLYDHIVQINFKNKTISFSRSKPKLSKGNFHFVKLKSDWRRMIYVTIATKNRRERVVLDTGSPNYLMLKKDWVSEFKNEELLQSRQQFIVASNSSKLDTLLIYKGHNISLQGIPLSKDFTILSNASSTVGKGFLEGFEEVILNAKSRKMYISKKQVNPQQKSQKLTCLTMNWKDGSVRITGLAINNQLQEIGIKMNDKVVRVNNFLMDSIMSKCDYKNFETLQEIYKSDLQLLIDREGNRFEYNIPKRLVIQEWQH